MFDSIMYDFSRKVKFKDELLCKMKKLYKESQNKVIELSDDELNLVAAASGYINKERCPDVNLRCEDCENYIKIDGVASCSRGYLK